MSGDIVLSNALRTNLASLSNTQSLIDSTQARLSSGKKVNSALDNPLSFFSAQALNNRSSALSNLLDGIGQSIQTIQAANTGVTSLTSLVNQAQSIANQAQAVASSSASTATIAGTTDVSKFNVTSTGLTDAVLKLTVTGKDGKALALATGSGSVATSTNVATIDLSAGKAQSIADIVTAVNSIKDTNGNAVATASINATGGLQIVTNNGDNVGVGFVGSTGGADATKSTQLATAFGFGGVSVASGNASLSTGFTLKASSSISSTSLYTDTGQSVAKRTTALTALKDSSGSNVFAITDPVGAGATETDSYSINIGVNGGAKTAITVSKTSTVQDLVDSINASALNGKISASFDEKSGQISFAAASSTTTSIEMSATATDTYGTTAATTGTSISTNNFGFGSAALTTAAAKGTSGSTVDAKTSATESIRFGAAAGDTSSYQTNYNKLLTQITALVKDSGYQGTNLLNSNNLTTNFNEDRSNSLTTTGGDFTAAGLGMKTADFSSSASIQSSIDQITKALTTIQSFGSSLSTDLSVMQTRQNFTKSLTSVLQTGSANLVNADTNEESANLLALADPPKLWASTPLSLASQSQQSVLKLFG